MELAFLVYDSRSGSTLISKAISENLDEILVTPEVGFRKLIRQYSKKSSLRVLNRDILFRELIRDDIANLNLTYDNLKTIINSDDTISIDNLIGNLILEYSRKSTSSSTGKIKIILIKYGLHIFLWPRIRKLFGNNSKFIFVYRDPRAVINSKTNTTRAYYPFEKMAWGGPMLAAIRWKQYYSAVRNASQNGLNVFFVSYENFLKNSSAELHNIAIFLGIAMKNKPTKYTYSIPKKEIKIHKLAMSSKLHSDRLDAWLTESEPSDVRLIESILWNEMIELGYIPIHKLGPFKKTMIIAAAFPKMIYKVLKHYLMIFFLSLFGMRGKR